MSEHLDASKGPTVSPPRQISDLAPFIPYFTDEDGFAAVYPELFAGQDIALKVEGFGPLKLAVYRNSVLRRLMIHPALVGNTPPAPLAEQAFYGVQADEGREEAVHRGATALARNLQNQIFTLNPPLHRAYRNVLGRHLAGPALEKHAPLMHNIVEGLLAPLADGSNIDFFSDFASPVAARFWGTLIGLTEDEERRIVKAMEGILPMFNIMMSSDDVERAGTSMADYMAIVSQAVDRSLLRGDNALLQDIANEFNAIKLEGDAYTVGVPPESVGVFLASNLFDAFHTAGVGAANCVYRLLCHPSALEMVRSDRTMVPNAVFEGLRLDPPLTLSQRYAVEDFVFDGIAVPKGTQVVMLWGAGNRDPEAFPHPDVYDLSRPQRGSIAFGGGVRMCMGRSVAQLLIETIIEAVTEPGVDVVLTGARYELLPMSLMRQRVAMPVSIHRHA